MSEGVGEPAEVELERALGGGLVLGRVRRRLPPVAVVGHPDHAALAALEVAVVDLSGGAVGAEHLVAGPVRPVGRGEARSERALAVADDGRHPRLVERDPVADPIAERVEADPRVVGEGVGHAWAEPAAVLGLEREREVPVVERHPRRDPVLEERVDEVRIKPEAGLVRGAGSGRLDARPRDREPVGGQAKVGHERDVLAEARVVVAGDVAGVAVGDPAGRVGEGVPHRRPLTVGVPRPLDLVGGRGGAPHEVLGEAAHARRGRGRRRADGSRRRTTRRACRWRTPRRGRAARGSPRGCRTS